MPRARTNNHVPIKWTSDTELKLFLAILSSSDVKVDNAKVAEMLGGSSSSISQHMSILRNLAKTVFSAEDPAAAFTRALSTKNKKLTSLGPDIKDEENASPAAKQPGKKQVGAAKALQSSIKVDTPPTTPDGIKDELKTEDLKMDIKADPKNEACPVPSNPSTARKTVPSATALPKASSVAIQYNDTARKTVLRANTRTPAINSVLTGRIQKPSKQPPTIKRETPQHKIQYDDLEDPLLEFSEEYDEVTRGRGRVREGSVGGNAGDVEMSA